MSLSILPEEERKKIREEFQTLSDKKKEGVLSSEEEKRLLDLERLNERYPFLHFNKVPEVVVRRLPNTSRPESTNPSVITEETDSEKQMPENQLSFGELVDRAYKSLGVNLEA